MNKRIWWLHPVLIYAGVTLLAVAAHALPEEVYLLIYGAEKCIAPQHLWLYGGMLLLFAAGLYLLSSFIWTVRVEGNERLETADLLSACEDMGVKPGVWKRGVDTAEITNALLIRFSDISWVSVSIKGTDVTIKLAETIEKAERIDRETPCDIVASADGVIVQITAETGEAGRLIEDMSKQLAVLKETNFASRKKSTENKLQLCIIGIFIMFTVLIFVLCIASMTGSADILF